VPDIIDEANDTAELFLDAAIRVRKAKAPKVPTHGIGMCLNCSADCGDKRWCDSECRNDWEADNKRKVRR
jgi:hypothetical protein